MEKLAFTFKQKIWVEVIIPQEYQETILKEIKAKNIKTADDVFNYLDNVELDAQYLIETSEPITTEENKGVPTIEVHKEQSWGEIIFKI